MQKTKLPILVILAITFVYLSTSCSAKQENKDESYVTESKEDIVQKGQHLIAIMGCNDCHSPKKMGANGPEIIPELMLSGYPADRPIIKFDDPLIKEGFAMFYPDLTAGAGPWGVSFAGNLTPDETGIKNWTEAQFKKAITAGKYKGLENERMLLPPMPWFNYVSLTDEEVHAMFMYLKSIKPVNNVVPAPISPDNM